MITEMVKSIKTRAEEAFASFNRHQEKKARNKMFKARQERAEHAAHLRGLRLAKEADLKEAADKVAAEKTAAKEAAKTIKKKKQKIIKSTQLPKAHRPM